MLGRWIVTVIAVFALAGPARAADWWFVGANDDFLTVVDAESIAPRGHALLFTARQILPAPDAEGVVETRHHLKIDCAARTSSLLVMVSRNAAGENVDVYSPGRDIFEPVAPGSFGALLADFVCADDAARGAEESWADIGEDLDDRVAATRDLHGRGVGLAEASLFFFVVADADGTEAYLGSPTAARDALAARLTVDDPR